MSGGKIAISIGIVAAACAIASIWTGDSRWFGTSIVLAVTFVVAGGIATYPRD